MNDSSGFDAARGADAGRRYRILTWQVHGNYLYYLTQAPTTSTCCRRAIETRVTAVAPAASVGEQCSRLSGGRRSRHGIRLRALPVARSLAP